MLHRQQQQAQAQNKNFTDIEAKTLSILSQRLADDAHSSFVHDDWASMISNSSANAPSSSQDSSSLSTTTVVPFSNPPQPPSNYKGNKTKFETVSTRKRNLQATQRSSFYNRKNSKLAEARTYDPFEGDPPCPTSLNLCVSYLYMLYYLITT